MSRALDITTRLTAASQWIPAAAIASGVELNYAGTQVFLNGTDILGDTGAQAARLQAILRGLSADLGRVTVTYDTERGAYQIHANELQQQWLPANVLAEGARISYGSGFATLAAADIDADDPASQAAKLQARLRTVTGMSEVTVGFDTERGSYKVSFSDTQAATQLLSYDPAQVWAAEEADLQKQYVPLAAVLAGQSFQFGTASVTLLAADISADTGEQAGLLQDKLNTVAGLGSVTVSYAGDRFIITFSADEPASGLITYGAAHKAATTDSAQQWLPALSIHAGTVIAYGSTTLPALVAADIGLSTADQAAKLQAKLRAVAGLGLVTVTYDTEREAYQVSFDESARGAFLLRFDDGQGDTPAATEAAAVLLYRGTTGFFEVGAGNNLSHQWLDEALVRAGTVLHYGAASVTLFDTDITPGDRAAQAAKLQQALNSGLGLNVTVTFDAQIGSYHVSSPTAPTSVLSYTATTGYKGAAVEVETGATLALPTGIESATFRGAAGSPAVVHFTSAATIRSELAALMAAGGLDNIEVTGTGAADDPWLITLLAYDVSSPIRVEYKLNAAMMAANPVGTYQVIKRLNPDSGQFELERAGGRDLVYSSAENVSGSDFYITAYRTVENEGPRMLEKDVWADLDGDGRVEKTGKKDWFEDPLWETDGRVDSVSISGSSADDYFLIGHEVLNRDGPPDQQVMHTDTVQVAHQRLGQNGLVTITLRGIDLATAAHDHDTISIDAGAGNDRLIAGLIPNSTEIRANRVIAFRAADELELIGGEGDDWIVGTRFADLIVSGAGNDTVTGNAGVDSFIDGAGFNTLIEQRDLNFSLAGTSLTIAGQQESLEHAGEFETVSELEDITDFQRFRLFGGQSENQFSVTNFTRETFLDGTEKGDSYVITLSGALSGASAVHVTDSGSGSTDNDSILITGGGAADTLHLDADASRQEVLRTGDGPFQLTYHNETTASIVMPDTATLAGAASATLSGNVVEGETWTLVIDQGLATEQRVNYQVRFTDHSIGDVTEGMRAALDALADYTATVSAARSS